jgi:hypothetical protein
MTTLSYAPGGAQGIDVHVSVVICSIDAKKFADVTALYSKLLAGEAFEIVGVHDAKSLAEGYTRGIAQARGEILILSHDDIRILSPNFATTLSAHLAVYDLIGVAGTSKVVGGSWLDSGDPYLYVLITTPEPMTRRLQTVMLGGDSLNVANIQALDGVFLAMRKEVARQVGFDSHTFDGFHLYDLDFSYRAYLAGYRLAVCRDIVVVHDSVGKYDHRWAEYSRRFKDKFHERLPSKWRPRDGARAEFFATSDSEVISRCSAENLAPIIRQITNLNSTLA